MFCSSYIIPKEGCEGVYFKSLLHTSSAAPLGRRSLVQSMKLPERIKAAEAAIFLRQQALANISDGHAERQAIEDAMHALGFLQTEKLGYPDWKK